MLSRQQCPGLLEARYLGIDFGNQLGCVHIGQGNPNRFVNLLQSMIRWSIPEFSECLLASRSNSRPYLLQ